MLALSCRRWADKGVVDVNCLIKQLGTVEVLDSLGGFGKSRVFDQCISLE